MSSMDLDPTLLIGLSKLAESRGDGLVPQLMEALADRAAVQQNTAEIVRLPGLHERVQLPSDRLAEALRRERRQNDNVLSFPAPRWQRNAERRER